MFELTGNSSVGSVEVKTTSNRGHSPEEIADLALSKILVVGEKAPPAIRDQAIAYRAGIKNVLVYYMNKMAESERTTIWALMRQQGHEDVAEIIRRL
jgi:hypothetical protein